jgi:CYTH domain-containing protein
MLPLRSLQALSSLGLEFWLPLPLLGLAFWVGGGFVMDQMLSRSYVPEKYLQADTQPLKQAMPAVVSIKVDIEKHQGIATVKVKTVNSALKELEFEFPATECSQAEAVISQELGLPRDRTKNLVICQSQVERSHYQSP